MELQLTDSPGWEASANIVYAFVIGYIAVFWVSLLFIILVIFCPITVLIIVWKMKISQQKLCLIEIPYKEYASNFDCFSTVTFFSTVSVSHQ